LSKGWDNKLTELLGEHLTASYLTRHGLVVSFTPKNMPNVDLLATNEALRTLPIQQKTIRTGTAQMDARDFLDIEFVRNKSGKTYRQIIQDKLKLSDPKLPYVFVFLGKGRPDEFDICYARDVQNLVYKIYGRWLKKVKGIRPRNPESPHCGLTRRDLAKFRDRWDVILNHPVFNDDKRRTRQY
jgi:hypothetical protein